MGNNYENEFEAPSGLPDAGGMPSNPIVFQLDYKSGRTQPGYAATATAEQSGAGFSYYSKAEQARLALSEMAFYILGSYWRMAGEVGEGDGKRRFRSNLVSNTDLDVFYLREQYVKGGGISKVGTKDEIKAWCLENRLDKAAGLGVTLVCYCPHLNAIIEMDCSKRVQDGMKKAVESATGKTPGKWFFLGFNSLSTEFWGFSFSGQFTKVDKEGGPWRAGELFFEPQFKCGVIKHTSPRFEQLNRAYEEVSEYVESVNSRIRATYERALPQTPMQQPPFATTAPAPTPAPAATRGNHAPMVPMPDEEPVFEDLPF